MNRKSMLIGLPPHITLRDVSGGGGGDFAGKGDPGTLDDILWKVYHSLGRLTEGPHVACQLKRGTKHVVVSA